MANQVAGMVVSLALNAVDYFRGLNKAEYEAKKFASNFERGMGTLRTAAKTIGVGLIVNEIYQLGKSIVSAAADLSDFADQTGSSVESLSKLANQAQIAGTPFEELQAAVLKLSIGMGGAGEKSEKVNRALKTLGVTAKDPATAMQQIAVALAKYEDGATKAAYANELFGKSGAKFLATLADMAKLQDVVGTTTAEQARKAEELEQAYQKLNVEAAKFKGIVLDFVVPALLAMVTRFLEARRASNDLFETLKRWSQFSLFGTATEDLDYFNKEIAKLEAKVANPTFLGFKVGVSDQLLKELAEMKRAREQIIREQAQNVGGFPSNAPPITAKLPGLGGGKAGGRAARTPADRISDAERYLANLEQQLQKTQELTAQETLLADVEAGRFKVESAAQMARGLALTEQIDAAKAMEKAEKERTKLAAEEARTREQTSKMKQQGLAALQAETETLAQGNEQLRAEIEAIGLDATSMAQLTAKRLEDAAATKEQTAAMYRNAGQMEEEASALENQARLLRERKGILMQKGVAEQMAADVAKAKEINDLFVDSFAEGAKSIIQNSKSIGDAIKNMGQRITDTLLDLALQDIAKSLFGAPTSSGGGGIFGGIGAAIMSGIFGAGGGQTFQFGRAYGGPVAAGTPYMVGERGPEMFIPKTAGTVVANNQLGHRGNFVFNINVPAGASRSTIDQTRVKFGLELQNALDRGS